MRLRDAKTVLHWDRKSFSVLLIPPHINPFLRIELGSLPWGGVDWDPRGPRILRFPGSGWPGIPGSAWPEMRVAWGRVAWHLRDGVARPDLLRCHGIWAW